MGSNPQSTEETWTNSVTVGANPALTLTGTIDKQTTPQPLTNTPVTSHRFQGCSTLQTDQTSMTVCAATTYSNVAPKINEVTLAVPIYQTPDVNVQGYVNASNMPSIPSIPPTVGGGVQVTHGNWASTNVGMSQGKFGKNFTVGGRFNF